MDSLQISSNLLMIRPASFGFNTQTATTNSFQSRTKAAEKKIQELAKEEFNALYDQLIERKIKVKIFDDLPEPAKRDAVFPNNWLSALPNGLLCIHPMLAENRRIERRKDIIEWIHKKFEVKTMLDFSRAEEENKALEGTGSIVMDHINKIAYVCLSPRTDLKLFEQYCERSRYRPHHFQAFDEQGKAIYHTNVMLHIGSHHVVVYLDGIKDSKEKKELLDRLKGSGRTIIEIDQNQLNAFCGNIIEVKNQDGKHFLLLSRTAYEAFSSEQIFTLESSAELIIANVPIIEKIGGGGVRCMIAEIFIPLKEQI